MPGSQVAAIKTLYTDMGHLVEPPRSKDRNGSLKQRSPIACVKCAVGDYHQLSANMRRSEFKDDLHHRVMLDFPR